MATIIYSDTLTPEKLKSFGQTERDYIYNTLDCCVTFEVFNAIQPLLDDQTRAIYRFERDLQGPVLEMNLRGILVDKAHRGRLIDSMQKDIERVEHNLDVILKGSLDVENFNWDSHQQVKKLLYETLGLPVQKKRQKGGWSATSDRAALEKLLGCNFYTQPIINHILCLKDMGKRLSTIKTAVDDDGRMRTTYGIAGTETGRFSSYGSAFDSGGNLQNWEKQIRQMLIADPGMKFAYIDLKTAESIALGARCWNLFHDDSPGFKGLGHAAGKYLDATLSNDVHTDVARECWPKCPWTGDPVADRAFAEGTKLYRDHDYRHIAKQMGHATNLYGQPSHLSKKFKVPIDVVQSFQDGYFKGFPEIRMYHTWCAQQLMLRGMDTSLMGRVRWFFGRRDTDETLREFIAYSQQETVAHIIGRGIISLWRAHKCQLLLQVHDAVLIQYPEQLEDSIVPAAAKFLEIPIQLKHKRTITIPTDVQVGWNWGPVSTSNPDGMKEYRSHDARKRSELSLLDRRL